MTIRRGAGKLGALWVMQALTPEQRGTGGDRIPSESAGWTAGSQGSGDRGSRELPSGAQERKDQPGRSPHRGASPRQRLPPPPAVDRRWP